MTATTEDVWAAFRARLSAYIRARSRNAQDADDILQDVFVKVHRHLGDLDEANSLTSWLYRITHNTIIDHYRKKRPLLLEHEPPDAVAPEAEDLFAERALAPFLRELIDELPPTYRDALRLTELEGLTQREMGKRLGLSTSGAKSRVQRGRAIVRERLLECCHVELDRRRHVIDYRPTDAEPWRGDCSCASTARA